MKIGSNVPHISSITAAALLLLLFLGFFHPVTAMTQDLGRHILTGELILNQGMVPKVNLYAYTYPSFPFINHHWGAEVLFALLFRLAGFPGLFLMMVTAILTAFLLQILSVIRQVSYLTLAIVGVLSLGVMLERTDLRPEMLSFLLLSLFVTLLYRNRAHPSNWIFLLVPLQLLWTNLHIYFAVGLIVIGLFFLDTLISHRKKLFVPEVYRMAALLGLSTLAALINPNGLAGFLYPLRVFENYGYTIEENQSVSLLQSLGYFKPSFPYLFTYVGLVFLSLLLSYKKTKPIDWLLSVVFTYLAFSAVRNFPLLVFTTFIPFCLALNLSLTRVSRSMKLPPQITEYRTALLVILVAILFFWQGSKIIAERPLGYGVTPGAEKAVDFLLRENIHGPLFNNFDIGSYLIYRLYPTEKVFVDGRPEAYPKEFFEQIYIPMQQSPEAFRKAADYYGLRTIFFSHTDQTPWGITFLQHIMQQPDWKLVYLDDYVVILVKDIPEHEALIEKFGMDRDHLTVTKAEDSFTGDARMANFFIKVGWLDQAIPYFQAALKKDPTSCPVIRALAEISAQQNTPMAYIYQQQYVTSCQ